MAVAVAATAAMAFITSGHWVFALATFVLGKVAVTSSLAFYNALLPAVARPDEVDRVSTAGYALGYLGGGLLLAVNLVMIAAPAAVPPARRGRGRPLLLLQRGGVVALFSIPLFRRVEEPTPRLEEGESAAESVVRVAARRLGGTLRELRQHRDAGLLLLAFLVYNDAVNTIIRMGTTCTETRSGCRSPA